MVVVFEDGAELDELPLRDSLEHILLILCVVKKRSTLAGGAQLIEVLEIVRQEGLQDLLRTK